MKSMHIHLAVMTAAAMTAVFGCAQAPVINNQAPAAAMQELGSTVPPDQLLKDDRHVMAAGLPVDFDQLTKDLPETLTPEQAKKLLVTIPQDKVSMNDPQTFRVQQFYGRYFNRGFYGGFRNYYGGYGYYPYRNYYFPYYNYGGLYRRFYYNNYYYPFFYGYNNSYYPYYYYNSVYRPFGYRYGFGFRY